MLVEFHIYRTSRSQIGTQQRYDTAVNVHTIVNTFLQLPSACRYPHTPFDDIKSIKIECIGCPSGILDIDRHFRILRQTISYRILR